MIFFKLSLLQSLAAAEKERISLELDPLVDIYKYDRHLKRVISI